VTHGEAGAVTRDKNSQRCVSDSISTPTSYCASNTKSKVISVRSQYISLHDFGRNHSVAHGGENRRKPDQNATIMKPAGVIWSSLDASVGIVSWLVG
jgi:hypothetical protein